jgi:pseudouridine-5'-phosphate glycosidase
MAVASISANGGGVYTKACKAVASVDTKACTTVALFCIISREIVVNVHNGSTGGSGCGRGEKTMAVIKLLTRLTMEG